jgi:acyl-CoA synthetase (AMP-forming)/AMP-acid ligase II
VVNVAAQSLTWSQMIESRTSTDQPAVVDPDGAVTTIFELVDRAARAADWLDTVGAPAGDPIVAFVPATSSSIALLLAGATTTRPLAPLSPRFTAHELVSCINRLDGKGPLLTTPDHREVAQQVGGRVGRPVVVVPDDWEPTNRQLTFDQHPSDTVAVVHTSGTTSLPKAVRQTQGPLALRVRRSAEPIELGPGDRYATASAFHHQAGVGLILVALGAGATIIPVPHFSPESWTRLAELEPSHATVVPALIETLLAADALCLPSLRWIQYGSSPLHPDTAARVLREHPRLRLVQNLGQTEGSPITTLSHQDHIDAVTHFPHRLASLGRPIEGTELRIEGADDRGIGEICSRADHYFAPDPDGWLRTGDLGYVDEDGFVYLTGRKHDVINRGGEKIYPVEVEREIASHPSVREVAIAPAPDRRLGQVAHAYVVAADPAHPPDFEDLARYIRTRLAGYKIPDAWHLRRELPRNPSGKVLRRQLEPEGDRDD